MGVVHGMISCSDPSRLSNGMDSAATVGADTSVYIYGCCEIVCPAKEDEEGDGSDKGNAGRWAVVRNRISDIQADPGNKSTSFISNKVHPVEE